MLLSQRLPSWVIGHWPTVISHLLFLVMASLGLPACGNAGTTSENAQTPLKGAPL